jgi:hypothetical protein
MWHPATPPPTRLTVHDRLLGLLCAKKSLDQEEAM